MLVRLNGWNEMDVLALLSLLRKHLLYYIYTSNNAFADVVHTELSHKPASEIKEMVRSLMLQFALGLSTKNFRTDVIQFNGQEVYVYEHLYESISELRENKIGGMWLPDELSRFLQKACQYRDLFPAHSEMYFRRIQVWSKSVAETKSKFYAFRDIYIREKKRRLCQRKGVEPARLELLKKIFGGISPAHRTENVAVYSKALKLWTCEEMETLVDFLVRITAQIQRTGSSDLVDQVAETLRRTDGSCVNKLADMKEKFMKKLPTVRAANLPDTIYDPTSEANKIFSADWSNNNDPYALGYLALKSRSLKLTAARNKKRRGPCPWTPRPNLRSSTLAARGTSSIKENPTSPMKQDVSELSRPIVKIQAAVSAPPVSELHNKVAVMSRPPSVQTTPAISLPVNDYTAFVQDIAKQCQWTEEAVHNLLHCMQHSFGLYRSNKLVAFFYKVASLTSGFTFQDLFPGAQFILTQFERRFGSLDGFEQFVLTALDQDSSSIVKQQANDGDGTLDCAATSAAMNQRNVQDGTLDCAVTSVAMKQRNGQDGTVESAPNTVSTAVCTQSNVTNEETTELGCTEEAVGDENERGLDHTRSTSLAQQTFQPGTDDAKVKEDECKHVDKESIPLESPSRTPQTGNEDAADEHSSSTVGKQSSPEDTWDEGVDADVDMDDDGLDDQSTDSLENAWSGSSNILKSKGSPHNAKDSSCVGISYSPSGQYDSDSLKRPSKRGKDEQYGKNFVKKLRQNETSSAACVEDDRDDEDDEEDESYDEAEDDTYKGEDGGLLVKVNSFGSEGEHEKTPHPLQSMLNNLELQHAALQEKQRVLIERKEDREWRQRSCICMSTIHTPSFSSER
ncbi:unnamed protein product [Peronospora belbahrii]|uniref:Uncharacterized protein n=1 Tax=Peronospora belbahrii TaxID=622444 RepID=A0ABN8CV97_9STRA|nr:unnamed protein product [Peronospora belbahrii]